VAAAVLAVFLVIAAILAGMLLFMLKAKNREDRPGISDKLVDRQASSAPYL
jgi:hypothetical protein